MHMSFWIVLSWVFVLILTGINVAVFLKLKQASEGMMKSMFPNAKNMNEAMASMQQMMGGMGGMGNLGGMMSGMQAGMQGGKGGFKGAGGRGLPGGSDAQLKAAMELLKKSKR
jgi:hypothetical protein